MTGVVIKIDNDVERDAWARVLEAFGIREIYELPGLGHPLNESIKLETLDDLANYQPFARLVVVQPRDGVFVQGVTDLIDFEHPLQTIYIFGGTMTRLSQADLQNVAPAALVYIDAGDLYPAVAGSIVLWDRLAKRSRA